jgi:hypothetical protein
MGVVGEPATGWRADAADGEFSESWVHVPPGECPDSKADRRACVSRYQQRQRYRVLRYGVPQTPTSALISHVRLPATHISTRSVSRNGCPRTSSRGPGSAVQEAPDRANIRSGKAGPSHLSLTISVANSSSGPGLTVTMMSSTERSPPPRFHTPITNFRFGKLTVVSLMRGWLLRQATSAINNDPVATTAPYQATGSLMPSMLTRASYHAACPLRARCGGEPRVNTVHADRCDQGSRHDDLSP